MTLLGNSRSSFALGPAVLLVGAVLLLVAAFGAGCGAPATAETTGSVPGTEKYDEILAERYDDVFPDDRVLTVRIMLANADWEHMQANIRAKRYYRADIWIDDEQVRDVAVRTKGNSSLMRAGSARSFRAGLKVDFNFFNSSRTYHGLKKLVYNNGFSDPTLMREFLGYEVMAQMGLPAPRACFVDLWVNDTHLGVYTQVEAVDGTFVSDRFADGNGNLYKPEAGGRLDWTEADTEARAEAAPAPVMGGSASTTTTTSESFHVGGGDLEEIIERLGDDAGWIPGRLDAEVDGYTTVSTFGWAGGMGPGPIMGPGGVVAFGADSADLAGLKTNQDRADHSRLYALLEVLNREPEEVSSDDLEAVLDVDEVLRFLAASVALVHLDNYIGMGHNYYLYEDGGRFSIIPWDLNMAFGGFDSGLSEDRLLGFYIDEPTAGAMDQYPLVEQLMNEPGFLETYRAYLREIIAGPFSVERMTARINEIADLIRPYVQKDANLLFSLEDFERGLTSDLASSTFSPMQNMGGKFIGLTYFVTQRTASIAAQLTGAEAASKGDGSGNGGFVGLGGMLGPPGQGGFNAGPGAQGGRPAGGPQPTVPPGGGGPPAAGRP